MDLTRPRKLDWRWRWKINWVTKAKNQNPCPSCWIFAAVGVVESMVRIEHCTWCLRSEGDFRRGNGTLCGSFGDTDYVLNWIKDHGIADPECFPWVTDDRPYTPTSDRAGRTVDTSVGCFTLGRNDIEGQKNWLDAIGPITGVMNAYQDFMFGYNGSYQIYRKILIWRVII